MRVNTFLAAVAAVVSLSVVSAHAQLFFGEDINTTPPGQNEVPRGPRTNADAAYAQFIATAPVSGVENFESFAPFNQSSFTLNLSFPATAITGTLSLTSGSSESGIYDVPSGTFGGQYPSSGARFLRAYADNSTANASVAFSAPVLGVGFYIIDVELARPTVRLTYTDATTQDFTVNSTIYPALSEAISGNILFWGFRTDSLPITQLEIVWSPTALDAIAIDDITVIVPEPASVLALGAGLVGLVRLRRRR